MNGYKMAIKSELYVYDSTNNEMNLLARETHIK
jgi:hypothetical protein